MDLGTHVPRRAWHGSDDFLPVKNSREYVHICIGIIRFFSITTRLKPSAIRESYLQLCAVACFFCVPSFAACDLGRVGECAWHERVLEASAGTIFLWWFLFGRSQERFRTGARKFLNVHGRALLARTDPREALTRPDSGNAFRMSETLRRGQSSGF